MTVVVPSVSWVTGSIHIYLSTPAPSLRLFIFALRAKILIIFLLDPNVWEVSRILANKQDHRCPDMIHTPNTLQVTSHFEQHSFCICLLCSRSARCILFRMSFQLHAFSPIFHR